MPAKTALNDDALDHVARRFAVLGEPSRLRILRELMTGELPVGELAERTGLEQANLSRHLQCLHQAGIVERRKEGLRVFYRVADPSIFDLCSIVCGSVGQRHAAVAKSLGNRR
jgi:ArsR family transcriptional regulator